MHCFLIKKGENTINDQITKDKLKGRYIFWDIDGTLAPYRFNNHVADPDGTNSGQSMKEIKNHVFLHRKPSILMQKIVNTCNAKMQIVMGHCDVQQENDDKQIWLDLYYPKIKERLFVNSDTSKADTIIRYCNDHKIDINNIIFVDDVIRFLQEAERKGITAYHISSFLDWDYQQ